jgi:hypothetical protein
MKPKPICACGAESVARNLGVLSLICRRRAVAVEMRAVGGAVNLSPHYRFANAASKAAAFGVKSSLRTKAQLSVAP